MESQPQNTEFRNNPKNFHPYKHKLSFPWVVYAIHLSRPPINFLISR